MSRRNDRDYIYLVWKDYKGRKRYIIGELSKNGKYEFRYRALDVDVAMENGFEPLIAFPNIKEVYSSYDVFPAFSSRLPDKRRKDIKEILGKYKLEYYDAFELLKKSGGKLPTDSFEFIDPIFLDEMNIVREFYIAGVRHYDYCNEVNKNIYINLNINEELKLEQASDNNHDKFAVKVMNKENKLIGYVPVFYSEPINEAIRSNRDMKCTVINKECSDSCEECIKVRITIK